MGLRRHFLIAGALILAISGASSAWSGWAFHRVSLVVDATVTESEEMTGAIGTLGASLERENDALLMMLDDHGHWRRELVRTRAGTNDALAKVDALLTSPSERETAMTLRHAVDAYQEAGDAVAARRHDADARIQYLEQVNPLLRQAIAVTAGMRDDYYSRTQAVATWARDQSTRAMRILAAVFATALLVSLLVAYSVGRIVLRPIGELSSAVDALRRGDFDRRVAVLRRDELGQLAGGFNRMADELGEFRRANIGAVIRAKETLEATLAALPDAVMVIDPDGNVSAANPRASAVMQAALGTAVHNLHELPLLDAARAAIAAALRGEAVALPADLSKAIALPMGAETRRLLPRIVPIAGLAGGRPGAVVVLSDVTELVRLDEMRMELVAVASHELQTPLTTLRMTLLMLQERDAWRDERDRDLVATALLGVDQLAVTVGKFLDLTRIEAGRLRLLWESVDMAALIAQAIISIKSTCEERSIAVGVDLCRRGELTVRGDAARLGAVLANILGNAVKYTPPDAAIDLVVEGDADEVRLLVTDGGPGVPVEFRERIFDKFFRVEHYRPHSEEGARGSGIGLYIAREIVVAHGGSIECKAGAPGRGACFVMTLPVAGGPPEGAGYPVAHLAAGQA